MSNWYLSRKQKKRALKFSELFVHGISDQLLDWAYDSDIDELLLTTINEYESNSATLLYTATLTPSVDSATATTTRRNRS